MASAYLNPNIMMAGAAQSTRPLDALHNAIRSLEAAVLVCMASPKKRPVHQLRTWTRRTEAQLELIALLPGTPRIPKQREKALRILRKLRREAGAVRDLDVEVDLVAAVAADFKGPSRTAVAIRKEAGALRRELKQQRKKEAGSLVSLLKKERKKMPLAFKDLSDRFAASGDAISEEKLVALVRDWYSRCNPQGVSASGDEAETLHAVRKRAKLARYMAESAPKAAARAQRLAARLEALQRAGGVWHDWLQLHKVARKQLGKSALLPQRFAAREARARRVYMRQLAKPIFR